MNAIIVTEVTPGKFEARLDGRLLCTSRQPFLDAARMTVPTSGGGSRLDGSQTWERKAAHAEIEGGRYGGSRN